MPKTSKPKTFQMDSERNPDDLHPALQAALRDGCAKWATTYPARPVPFLTCAYRTPARQNELYAQGRTAPGSRVTNARGGQSPHNFRPSFAFDVAFKRGDGALDWSKVLFKDFAALLATIAPGVEWGGHFRKLSDSPHFQLRLWTQLIPK